MQDVVKSFKIFALRCLLLNVFQVALEKKLLQVSFSPLVFHENRVHLFRNTLLSQYHLDSILNSEEDTGA